jgi:hypothetical protein
MHRALYHCVGRLGVHDIEYAMDDLVTFESQEGGAQYLFNQEPPAKLVV